MSVVSTFFPSLGIFRSSSVQPSTAYSNFMNNNYSGLQFAEDELNFAYNSAESQKARDWQSQEAQKARDWETQMSNSAVQRRVADLRAAGINPTLNFSEASTPVGTAFSSAPASHSSSAFSNYTRSQATIKSAEINAKAQIASAAINAASRVASSALSLIPGRR